MLSDSKVSVEDSFVKKIANDIEQRVNTKMQMLKNSFDNVTLNKLTEETFGRIDTFLPSNKN